MLPDIGLKRSTSVLTAKIVIVLSVLFLSAPSFAQTATDYVIYTGQAGAQTQIDAQHTSSWSISTSASVPSGSQFWGAQLTMKRGSSTTSTIKLTFYQGSSSAGTELGSVTLTPTPFTTQFNLVDFQLATPIVMQPNKQYYVTLTSPAPNVQSQAYFIKGLDKTAICPKNTTCNTSPAFTAITVNPVFETSKSILSVTRGGTALNISSGYTAAAGDVITYRVRVAESAGVGGSITLTESVPTNTSYSGTSEGWTGCSSGAVAGTTCTRSVTILARDATDNAGIPIPVDFNFTVTVGALTDGIASISNTVSASAGTCPTCTISSSTVPRLKISKTAPSSLPIGADAIYSLTVENKGGSSTSGVVTITDTLPTGLTFGAQTEGTPGLTCSASGQTVTCTGTPNLASNSSMTVSYRVDVGASATGTLVNSAIFTALGGDTRTPLNDATTPSAGNSTQGSDFLSAKSAQVATSVADPVVSKSLTAVNGAAVPSGYSVKSGDELRYTITLKNSGGSSASTTLTETVPANSTYLGPSEGWSCSVGAVAAATCTQAVTVSANSTATRTFTVKIGTLIDGILSISNQVQTSTGTCSSCTVTTSTAPRLQMSKSVPASLAPGESATYTLTIQNKGGSVTSGVVTVEDTLPVGLTFSAQTAGDPALVCAATGQKITCSGTPDLAVNATLTVSYRVDVSLTATGTLVNSALFTALGGDSRTPLDNASTPSSGTSAQGTDLLSAKSAQGVPSLKTVKTAATPSGLKVGDPINYTITVKNTGGVTITNVTVADSLNDRNGGVLTLTSGPTFSTGTNGATAASLPPGETLTYTASFTITQAVINAGGVSNTATASGKDPANNTVSDQSDNGNDTDGNTTNDPTATNIVASPALDTVKTASISGSAVGDVINYTITVRNVGNVTLSGITVADTMTDAKGGALTLTSGPTFSTGTNGATAASLPPGETLTYTASFTITQATINAGGVKNTATASGKDPANNTVSDQSDDGDDTDGNTTNDETVTPITTSPSLKTVKTATTPNGVQVGAPVNYTITVKNTGNVTVSNITIADTLTDAKGGVLSLTSGPTFSAGTNGATASSLPPGETLTYTASFTLTQAVINAGGVSNTATAAGKDPANNTVSDQSDNGNDTDGNSTNDPTITGVPAAPSLEAVKIATGTGSRLGDLINYTITVRNTGNVTLTGIALVDTLTDVNGAPLILSNGPTFSSGTNGATVDALPPGETLTFFAGFTITQAAINAGGVKNTVTVSGKDPAGQVVSDQSDNGNDSDGNTTNDPTITTIAGGPALKTVKTASFSGLGVGQPINYTITVKNTGNVTINNIMVVDTLTDAKGGPLALTSGPTWVGGSNGATAASLPPGETLTYTASVTITQAIINAGGVRNTATARGTDSASNTVSDRSDNGNDTDGNLNNDDTVTTITPVAALKAVKKATTTGLAAGEPINYTIAVKNIGNVPISNITVGDVLTDAKGAVLALSTGPTFSSGTNGATPALLPPGETLTYTASFTITQAVINAGGVRNTATVSGKDPANMAVSDVSDDGDDTDGNTANDQTVTPISVGPASLKTVKTATTTGVSVGDVVNYSITVKNTGGLTVSNIALNDTLTDAQGGALALTSGPTFTSGTNGATPVSLPPGETLTYNASFTITQAAINAGGLRNSATASGLDPSNNPVSDVSDDGNDADGNTSNDETVTPIVISPSLKTVKTATSTGLGIGDVVNYLITVKNTGNVTVSGVALADTLTDAQGGVLSLTSGPVFSSGTNGTTAAALPPGETLTYTASFAVTQAVIDAGGLRNSATATGKDPAGTVVVDVSDNGDDSDGNTQNDVTVTGFPNLTLSKTSLGSAEKPLLAGSPTRYDIQVVNTGTAPTNGAVVLETIGKGLQLNSLGGAGWVCTYANGEPLTLPAKGPLTARCVTSAPVSAQGGKAVPISASVTPLPGFLGQRLTTEASVDPRGGNNPPPTGSSCQPSTACASNGGEVTPEALPTVGIAFASPSIPIGGQTRVTVTVVNKTRSPLTALNQSQVLPAGLVFVADPKATTNCNGSVSVVGGALVLSGGALPGGGSCTFSAIVSSSSPNGTKFTATVPVGAIKNAEKKTNEAAASADLLVEGNFAVRKSFQSSQGALGVPVKLTIVIDNTGTSTLSEVSLVDEFPVAPGKLTIADEPQIENTCSGTVTATPRAGRLSLSGGVVPRAGCSISVMVVADAVGDYLNVIPDGGSSGSPNGLRGKLPDGSALTSAPGASARVNIDRPAAVAGVFTKRTGFGTQVPQAGVTVVLKDAEGRVVATTVTKADGSYLFENLPPTLLGDATTKYRVEFIAPSAAGSTLIKGSPEADNPTVNGVADKNGIAGVTLLPGEKTPDQNGFLVDPSGVVYDAITRRPVAGARVTLIGPNGSAVPNSLLDTVAGTVNGAATGANGLYVLLLTSNASSGVYRLRVDVPSGYRAGTLSSSSALIPAEIGPYEPRLGGGLEKVQAQDVAPTLDQSTAYYMSVRFVIASFAETSSNGIINNHLPIDPVAPVVVGELQLTKVGAVRTAELGDSVGYTLSLTNATNIPQYGVVVTDALPRGFKYIGRTGALTRGGEVIRDDAALGVADGDRVMNFRVVPTNGFLRPGETVSLTYRVRVGVGSLRSDGINRAKAASRNGASSNEARFAVRVDGGVFGDEACVIGAVYRDCNGNGVQDAGEKGIAGARVYFSDGAFMVSDANGRYSMCGRSPTTQVLKVDTTTLPEGSVLLPTSNRNAGDPGSLFADLKNGELHRADFALACEVTPPAEPLAPKSAESPLLERTTPPAIVAPSDNRPPAEPKEPDAPTLCWGVMIEEVLFETDSAELTPASVDLLNAVITQWRGRRDIALEVRGHTDSVASDLYNIRLSARRARAVREFLLAGGQFDAAQLTESSYGESQPRDTNTTVEGRARNRRVAIRISGAYCKSGAPLNISAPSVTGGG